MRTIYLFILMILSAFTINAQWSTDPNNNLVIATGWDPHIVSDSAGGCYITYNYDSFYPQKLAVERLDKYGYKPWVDRKQILGELPEQWQAEIIEDGEGGVIVSYEDNQVIGTDFTSRVRVQRVDSAGNFLWEQTGVRVTIEETNHGIGGLVSDGDGGCVIVWQNYDERIFINRIDRTGQRVWSETGIYLINTGDGMSIIRASDGQYYIQISNIYRINQNGQIVNQYYSNMLGQPMPDPEGGVVVSGFIGNIYNRKLVSQRKDSLGNNLWQEPYVEIADSLDIGTSLNILSNNDYYHYGWLGRKNGIAEILQIQSLRSNGTKLFIGGSIPLSPSPTSITSVPIISSLEGSNIYAWTQWDSPQTYNANYARRIDTTGTDNWFKSPVLLNEPSLGYFNMTTDCYGGAIGVGYLNADFAIRVLKVSVNGNLGEVITGVENYFDDLSIEQSLLYQNYPNPANPTTTIRYNIPERSFVTIKVYDVLGKEIAILVNEEKSSGSYNINFEGSILTSGIYFYQIKAGNFVETKKMILLK